MEERNINSKKYVLRGITAQHFMQNMFSESKKESPTARNPTNLLKISQNYSFYLLDLYRFAKFLPQKGHS